MSWGISTELRTGHRGGRKWSQGKRNQLPLVSMEEGSGWQVITSRGQRRIIVGVVRKEHTSRGGQADNKKQLSHHHSSHCLFSNYPVSSMGPDSPGPHVRATETNFCAMQLRKSKEIEPHLLFQSSVLGLPSSSQDGRVVRELCFF